MKRLPALMLSVFMLTLLCLPTSASNEGATNESKITVTKGENLPVYLTIDDSQMVDVTISWDALDYTYNGSGFTTESGTMPKITVQNNSVGKSIIMGTPIFNHSDDVKFTDGEFALYFYHDSAASLGSNVTDTIIKSGDSIFFYAIPSGNPAKTGGNLLGANSLDIGSVLITIGLPES